METDNISSAFLYNCLAHLYHIIDSISWYTILNGWLLHLVQQLELGGVSLVLYQIYTEPTYKGSVYQSPYWSKMSIVVDIYAHCRVTKIIKTS